MMSTRQLSGIKAGDRLWAEWVPPSGMNPGTVTGAHEHQDGGEFYLVDWANGNRGVLYPEDVAGIEPA